MAMVSEDQPVVLMDQDDSESDSDVDLSSYPAELKEAINDIEQEEEIPDDEQWQVLEDIWLKAGEMGESKINKFKKTQKVI